MKKFLKVILAAVLTLSNIEYSQAVNYPTSLDDDTSLYVATNNKTTALTSAVNNSTTTIPVISTTGFPSSGLIQIDAEIIFYGSKGGASFTSCVRGFDGSGASSHVDASVVAATVVAAYHEGVKDAVVAAQTKLGTGSSTASANTVLRGTGAGATAYGQVVSGDITQYTIALDRVVTGTAANILVYNSSNALASVTLSGVLSITSTGVTSLATGSVTSASILDGEIVNADINASAAIAYSKLAALSSGNILVGSAGNVATSVAMSGDVAIANTGATTIQANSVALTTDTTGNYALGDAEGGAATTGDSATSFFSTGTLENARLDADLTAIGDNSTDGIYARTGAGTVSARTITGTASEISVSNGNGVSGNPTLSLPAAIDLGGKNLELPNATSLTSTDCDDAAEAGRVFIDNNATTGQQFYYCEGAAGWVGISGSGGSSALTVSEEGTPLDATVTTLDFLGADFDLTESPEDEINIVIAAALTRDAEWDTEAEVQTAWGSVNILLETEIDASSELAGLMDDESGSGVLVFGTGPTISLGENSIVNTGTAPTVNAAGEFAMDTNLLGTLGAYIGFDGTNVIRFVGIINTDTCTDNQIPKFDDDTDTWTCEADSTGSGSLGSSLSSTTDDITSSGDIQLLPDGDDVSVGSSSSTDPQKFHVFDGGSDNEPGSLVLYKDDGTAQYLFFRTDGTLAKHTSYPSDDDADGTAVTGGFSKPQDSATDNFRMSVTVVSSDLVLAVKGIDGFDPSATNAVSVRIGNTVRTITSALSVTLADGTNWFNSGSAQLATYEIDYFAYFVWDSNSSAVDIAISRIPYGRLVSDFSGTTTNEKYLSQYANYTSTDDVVNVGRLAATLSAGAGYTWTVPTFTNANLNNRPTFETRWLTFDVTLTVGAGGTPVVPVYLTFINRYKIRGTSCSVQMKWSGDGGNEGNGTAAIVGTLPFAMSSNIWSQNRLWFGYGQLLNNATQKMIMAQPDTTNSTFTLPDNAGAACTGAGQNNASRFIGINGEYEI